MIHERVGQFEKRPHSSFLWGLVAAHDLLYFFHRRTDSLPIDFYLLLKSSLWILLQNTYVVLFVARCSVPVAIFFLEVLMRNESSFINMGLHLRIDFDDFHPEPERRKNPT